MNPTHVTPPPQPLEWTCSACGFPIADGMGYIHVSLMAAFERFRLYRQWEEARGPDVGLSIDDFLEMPDRVSWEIHHGACDPQSDREDYWIDVARARTYAALLRWTSHLAEKNWIDATNWMDLMGAIGHREQQVRHA